MTNSCYHIGASSHTSQALRFGGRSLIDERKKGEMVVIRNPPDRQRDRQGLSSLSYGQNFSNISKIYPSKSDSEICKSLMSFVSKITNCSLNIIHTQLDRFIM